MHIRREFLATSLAAVSIVAVPAFAKQKKQSGMTLGFSTYALPNRSLVKAIQLLSETGYDSVEFCVFPPRGIPKKQEQAEIVKQLDSTSLKLTSLMENLNPLGSRQQIDESSERFKRACEYANQFPDKPLIQTVLGGKNWPAVKDRLRDQLATWQKIATDAEVILAIKPHRGHAMSRPADAIWLIDQLGNSPWLRICFDYSHFIFRGLPMEEMIQEALPYTAHIAVKDAEQVDGKVVFRSPGDAGTIDYTKLIKQFQTGGYRGDICVEVSSQVWRSAEYDSLATVKSCYSHMAEAMKLGGVSRR